MDVTIHQAIYETHERHLKLMLKKASCYKVAWRGIESSVRVICTSVGTDDRFHSLRAQKNTGFDAS